FNRASGGGPSARGFGLTPPANRPSPSSQQERRRETEPDASRPPSHPSTRYTERARCASAATRLLRSWSPRTRFAAGNGVRVPAHEFLASAVHLVAARCTAHFPS